MVGLATTQFDRFSRQVLQQRRAGDLPLVTITHPLGGIPTHAAQGRITPAVVDAVVEALTDTDPHEAERS